MEHPQHCQHLAEQIAAETDEAKREKLRAKFREECQEEPVTMEEPASTLDSGGGGGPTPPPQPPKRP